MGLPDYKWFFVREGCDVDRRPGDSNTSHFRRDATQFETDNGSMTDWKRKLAAYLHDPPSKSLEISDAHSTIGDGVPTGGIH